MNKNSNIYQMLYAAVMVLIVGTVLALIYMALKPKQNENIAKRSRRLTRNTSSKTCSWTARATSWIAPRTWLSTWI